MIKGKGSSRLGRGIETLIPRASKKNKENQSFSNQKVDIKLLRVNPRQPRKHFDEAAIKELANSIQEKGMLQPIVARRMGHHFEIIAGERRFRASKKIGLKEVPIHIVKMTDQEQFEAAIIENVIREDLSAMETARAFQKLQKEFSLSQEEIAKRTGKNRSSVANHLRLFGLPASVQKLVEEKSITIGHAKALLAFDKPAQQIELSKLIINKKLSVREVENWSFGSNKKNTQKTTVSIDNPNLRSKLEDIQRHLGTKVTIAPKGKNKGNVVISYHHDSELNKIIHQLIK